MKRDPGAPGQLPSVRPHVPIDRLQGAVLAAIRRQTVRERRPPRVLTRDKEERSKR
jgi:hypothetical protein